MKTPRLLHSVARRAGPRVRSTVRGLLRVIRTPAPTRRDRTLRSLALLVVLAGTTAAGLTLARGLAPAADPAAPPAPPAPAPVAAAPAPATGAPVRPARPGVPLTLAQADPGSAARQPSDISEFIRRNPFALESGGQPSAPPPTPDPAPPPPVVGPSTEEVLSKLTLTGTYVSARASFASIKGADAAELYPVGGRPLSNVEITDIEPRRIAVRVDGRPGWLEMQLKGWDEAPAEQAAAPGTPTFESESVAGPSPLRRLPRAEVDHYLENLGQVLTQVSIQPEYQNGRQVGFKLGRIQRGSIFGKLGLQNGDVMRFINGQRIDSVQSAYAIYNILRDSTNVEMTVVRNTRPVVLRYLVY